MDAGRLLVVGDFGTISGFSRVTGALAPRWRAAGWDVAVLAVDYMGDATELQRDYRMYPAWPGGDYLGVGRVAGVVAKERPDLIFIINDAHVVAQYLARLGYAERRRVVAYIPVDGVGLLPDMVTSLNDCAAVVAYTEFGRQQLVASGLAGPLTAVIPHGVDTEVFSPGDRLAARLACAIPPGPFVVLMANRNQPRKALWLGMQAFAHFQMETGADAHLVYHGAMKDVGGPLEHYMNLFGIRARCHFNESLTAPHKGVKPSELAQLYRAADVGLTTTRGEGWGLTTMEGLACGLPQIVPDFGALPEWATHGAVPVPCYGWWWPHETGGTLGKVVKVEAVAAALADLWRDPEQRRVLGAAGRQLVSEPRFSWDVIAERFLDVFAQARAGAAAAYAVERQEAAYA